MILYKLQAHYCTDVLVIKLITLALGRSACTHQLMFDGDVILARHVEDAGLYKLCEAPEGLCLIIQGCQERGKKVGHPLTIADLWFVNQVVQEDVPVIINNSISPVLPHHLTLFHKCFVYIPGLADT